MSRYANEFDPILPEGMTATIFGQAMKRGIPEGGLNVKCVSVGALPEYQKDWSTLTTVTWSRDNEDTNLEMGPMELAQLRMRILDDFKVELKHPAAVQQWRTARTNFYLRQWPGDEDDAYKNYLWRASEFFVYEDTTPRFDLYSELTRTQNRIMFSGWKFKLRKITEPGRIILWINSWPPGS